MTIGTTSPASVATAIVGPAPSAASVDTVTARAGSFSAAAKVTVAANSLGLKDAALGSLVDTLDADGLDHDIAQSRARRNIDFQVLFLPFTIAAQECFVGVDAGVEDRILFAFGVVALVHARDKIQRLALRRRLLQGLITVHGK